jgi:hypothetical protein
MLAHGLLFIVTKPKAKCSFCMAAILSLPYPSSQKVGVEVTKQNLDNIFLNIFTMQNLWKVR